MIIQTIGTWSSAKNPQSSQVYPQVVAICPMQWMIHRVYECLACSRWPGVAKQRWLMILARCVETSTPHLIFSTRWQLPIHNWISNYLNVIKSEREGFERSAFELKHLHVKWQFWTHQSLSENLSAVEDWCSIIGTVRRNRWPSQNASISVLLGLAVMPDSWCIQSWSELNEVLCLIRVFQSLRYTHIPANAEFVIVGGLLMNILCTFKMSVSSQHALCFVNMAVILLSKTCVVAIIFITWCLCVA